jgi:transposase-like protein
MPRKKYRKFSPEFRDEAVRLVVETSRPIAQVARGLGVNDGTLGNWVNQYREQHADDEPPSTLQRGLSTSRSGCTRRERWRTTPVTPSGTACGAQR